LPLEALGARNYAEGTLEGRRDTLKVFLGWSADRDLQRGNASHPAHPRKLSVLFVALKKGQRGAPWLEYLTCSLGCDQRLFLMVNHTEYPPP
jgi:hypothetical protein